MRSPSMDAALVAVPALLMIAAASLAGHWLLEAVADGRWFSTSLLFIPVFFLFGMVASNFSFDVVEDRLGQGVRATKAGKRVVIAVGAIAAIIGGDIIAPSVFVAIVVSTFGSAFALNARLEALQRKERAVVRA